MRRERCSRSGKTGVMGFVGEGGVNSGVVVVDALHAARSSFDLQDRFRAPAKSPITRAPVTDATRFPSGGNTFRFTTCATSIWAPTPISEQAVTRMLAGPLKGTRLTDQISRGVLTTRFPRAPGRVGRSPRARRHPRTHARDGARRASPRTRPEHAVVHPHCSRRPSHAAASG